MAMLADPRRKQKISIDPRGSAWSNDDSKFGQKLMEKMGWAKGKGLGANEDGKTEHVSVSLKNDTRGVGCSKNHSDNWIAHQDDFNSLLSNLNQDHAGNDSKSEDKVTSLEHNSKTSKGRVHYQKFTKGKDLSLKSENELDCVFGKRKSQSGTNTPQDQSEPNSDSEGKAHGIPTTTSTDSVQDYFKRKMAEKKNRLLNGGNSTDNLAETSSSIDRRHDDEDDEPKFGGFGFGSVGTGEDVRDGSLNTLKTDIVNENDGQEKRKKNKKSKKRKIEIENDSDNMDVSERNCEVNQENVNEEGSKLKKNKKKSKTMVTETEHCGNDVPKECGDTVKDEDKSISDSVNKKKSKKKKSRKRKAELKNETSSSIEESVEVTTSKKKKRKDTGTCEAIETAINKDDEHGDNATLPKGNNDVRSVKNKKKKKKNPGSVTANLKRLYKQVKHLDKNSEDRSVKYEFPGASLHGVEGYRGLPDDVVSVALQQRKIRREHERTIVRQTQTRGRQTQTKGRQTRMRGRGRGKGNGRR